MLNLGLKEVYVDFPQKRNENVVKCTTFFIRRVEVDKKAETGANYPCQGRFHLHYGAWPGVKCTSYRTLALTGKAASVAFGQVIRSA